MSPERVQDSSKRRHPLAFGSIPGFPVPLYMVFSHAFDHKQRKYRKKTLIFLKKGIDFIENFAIIG
jgi:hypothetical protein